MESRNQCEIQSNAFRKSKRMFRFANPARHPATSHGAQQIPHYQQTRRGLGPGCLVEMQELSRLLHLVLMDNRWRDWRIGSCADSQGSCGQPMNAVSLTLRETLGPHWVMGRPRARNTLEQERWVTLGDCSRG